MPYATAALEVSGWIPELDQMVYDTYLFTNENVYVFISVVLHP